MTSVHTPADTRIAYRECASLAEAGYDVVLIAPGTARLPPGVRLRSLPVPANRLARMTQTMWRVYRAALDERADIYHFHDPELIFVGLLLKMRGARVIFDVHEDIPSDIADKRWIPRALRPPVGAAVATVLKVLHARYNAIVTATPTIARHFPDGHTVVICNYPRIEELAPPASAAFEQRPSNAVYLGNITELRGIVELMQAYDRPEMPAQSRLILAGEFEDAELSRRIKAMPGWQRVDFLGWCDRSRVADALSRARVGLVTLRPARNFEDALPVKMFEYMGAGLPVIISKTIRAGRIVVDHDCGIAVDPMNPGEIARAIRFFVENPARAREMGERGRELVLERYQWFNEAQKLQRLYAAIA
ncbi:MAG TPA: glycosyltransferase family 4 protein [Candidatus Baltobacteraceae bacterium]|nr:glycosyltransferase family 4 protein [Candidatus Baltobacteraceae bacterium]